jgi:hypothetical protein
VVDRRVPRDVGRLTSAWSTTPGGSHSGTTFAGLPVQYDAWGERAGDDVVRDLASPRRAQPIVRDFCARHGVSYSRTGLLDSYGQVPRHLHNAGAPLRA